MNRFFDVLPEQVLQGVCKYRFTSTGQFYDISDDGQHFACIEQQVVRVYDLANVRLKFSLLVPECGIRWVSIATATRRVLTGSTKTCLTIWDLDTGLVVGQLSDYDDTMHNFTLSSDHSRLLTSSIFGVKGTRVYDIVNAKFLAAFTSDENCTSAFHTGNNNVVLCKPASTGIAKLRLLLSGRREPEITGRSEEVDWGTIQVKINDATSYRDDRDDDNQE